MTEIKKTEPRAMAETLSLAATEQATGLTREVLRKWEQRYGFPTPRRDVRGQRTYLLADVQRLQVAKRLINQGLRPGKLLTLSMEDLLSLPDKAALAGPNPLLAVAVNESVTSMLAYLAPGAGALALRPFLGNTLKAAGLAVFVGSYLPAFNHAVGAAWADGHLAVYAEHHYTETVRQLVLTALSSLPASQAQPRVLLTTPPGELHGLGLLALQAALMLQGAHCISLGTQTPVADVARAVSDLGVGLVAISASSALLPDELQRYLSDLRHSLPVTCLVWVGGQGCASLSGVSGVADQGVQFFQSTQDAVQAWQALSKRPPFLL